jgi:D-alanyl-D-alanine carboxypeptidase/D-alanyl-D-alanine-endopeptidase (penicillin-binding protein 4)
MIFRQFYIFFIAVCLCIGFYDISAQENHAHLESEFNELISSPIYDNVDIGVLLYEMSPQYRRVFRKNAFQPLVPASILKVLITTAALHQLGPSYQFETIIATEGVQKGSTLDGNLYIIGRGAPDITLLELEDAVSQLYQKGIRTVKGNLIYDNSYFTKYPPKHPRIARYYDAPSGALTVNSNAVKFVLPDGQQLNSDILMLVPSPNTSYVKYNYRDLTIDLQREDPGVPRIEWVPYAWGDDYYLSGVVGQKDFDNHYLNVLVSRPGLYAATIFREQCVKKGIVITGETRSGRWPQSVSHTISIRSKPLHHFVTRLNQESNNVIAENMIQFLGRHVNKNDRVITDSMAEGIQYLRDFCKTTLSINPLHFILEDVSGLSINNKFKAADFMRILSFVHKDPILYQSVQNSLIKQGVTQGFRFSKPPASLDVFLKTGTLAFSGVNTMVGFIENSKMKKRYAFVIMANRQGAGEPAYKGTYTYPILDWFYGVVK